MKTIKNRIAMAFVVATLAGPAGVECQAVVLQAAEAAKGCLDLKSPVERSGTAGEEAKGCLDLKSPVERSGTGVFCGLTPGHLTPMRTDPRLDISNLDAGNLDQFLDQAANKPSSGGWTVRPTIGADGHDLGVEMCFRYTGNGKGGFVNNAKEFAWGISRPLHLYNHDERTGKLEILPFYLDPIEAGGALSPLNPYAWKENAPLTFGALTADLAIAGTIYALSQDKDKSPRIEYARDTNGNIVYRPNPTTGTLEPVIIPDGYNYNPETGITTIEGETYEGGTGNTSGGDSGDDTGTTDGSGSSGGGSGSAGGGNTGGTSDDDTVVVNPIIL